MNSVSITIGHRWQDDVRHIHSLRQRRPADTSLNLLELRDIVDIVIDGTNLTAPVSEEAIFGFFDQTMTALVELIEERSRKAIIEFHHQPWELVLVPDGATLQLSLYSVDRRRRVVARDLPIRAHSFIDAICEAAEEMLTGLFRISEHFSSNQRIRRISQSMAQLKRRRRIHFPPGNTTDGGADKGMRLASTSSPGGLTFGYRFDAGDRGLQNYRGEHVFDLHALLFPGLLEIELGDRTVILCREFPFLAIGGLLDRTRQLFNQLETGANAPFVLDEELAHLDFSVQGQGTRWKLAVRDDDSGDVHHWSGTPSETLDGLVSIAELFVQDLVETNPNLEVNERFVDLRREVEKLRRWHRDLCCNNVYHDRPEDYLRRLGHLQPAESPPASPPGFPWPLSSVHTLFPRRMWTLRAERIDFRSLLLDSRSMVAATSDGVQCLNIDDGRQRWSRSQSSDRRARSPDMVATGDTLVIHAGADRLEVADRNSGEDITVAAVDDDWTGLAGAARYNDELTIAASRNGQLVGFDPTVGSIHWRQSLGPGSLKNIVFDGPLVCAQSTEGVVTTFNPRTGDTLWKIRMGGTPEVPIQIHQGRLYTITHDPLHPTSTLHALYPFTGRTVWQLRLSGFSCGPPSFVDHWMVLPLERHGQIQLAGIDLEAVDPRINWKIELSSAGVDDPTAVLSVTLDGAAHGLVRTDRAELTCFRVADGEVRWQSMPTSETLLLHGNVPLFQLGEAVVNVSESVDLRELATGNLLHSFSAIQSPEFGFLTAPFRLLLGEQAPPGDEADRLTAFSMENFLAVVE